MPKELSEKEYQFIFEYQNTYLKRYWVVGKKKQVKTYLKDWFTNDTGEEAPAKILKIENEIKEYHRRWWLKPFLWLFNVNEIAFKLHLHGYWQIKKIVNQLKTIGGIANIKISEQRKGKTNMKAFLAKTYASVNSMWHSGIKTASRQLIMKLMPLNNSAAKEIKSAEDIEGEISLQQTIADFLKENHIQELKDFIGQDNNPLKTLFKKQLKIPEESPAAKERLKHLMLQARKCLYRKDDDRFWLSFENTLIWLANDLSSEQRAILLKEFKDDMAKFEKSIHSDQQMIYTHSPLSRSFHPSGTYLPTTNDEKKSQSHQKLSDIKKIILTFAKEYLVTNVVNIEEELLQRLTKELERTQKIRIALLWALGIRVRKDEPESIKRGRQQLLHEIMPIVHPDKMINRADGLTKIINCLLSHYQVDEEYLKIYHPNNKQDLFWNIINSTRIQESSEEAAERDRQLIEESRYQCRLSWERDYQKSIHFNILKKLDRLNKKLPVLKQKIREEKSRFIQQNENINTIFASHEYKQDPTIPRDILEMITENYAEMQIRILNSNINHHYIEFNCNRDSIIRLIKDIEECESNISAIHTQYKRSPDMPPFLETHPIPPIPVLSADEDSFEAKLEPLTTAVAPVVSNNLRTIGSFSPRGNASAKVNFSDVKNDEIDSASFTNIM